MKSLMPCARAITDGKRCHSDLKRQVAKHDVVICKDKKDVGKIFPWVHIAISNAKQKYLGIYHRIKRTFMQNYLNEFCYKFNIRYFGDKLNDRLMIGCIEYN